MNWRASRLMAGLLAAAVPLSASAAWAAPPVQQYERQERPTRSVMIVVNGEPLEAEPLVVAGRLLLPLRNVFDALGIVVTRSGNQISARLPTGSVAFTVGTSFASVDGRRMDLGARIIDWNGTTYAPLSLLNDAFGAQATYDQRGAKVEIVSADIGRNNGAEQQRAGGGTDVQGVIAAIDDDSLPPSITVVRAGTSRTISITSDAKMWTEDVTIHSQSHAALEDLRVGDAVHAILARDGRVLSVFDFFKSTSGTITAASSNAIVLHSGRVVIPQGTTEIALNGAAARLSDLRPGDFVTVRSNPESGELREIVASRPLANQPATATPAPGANAVAIDSVQLTTARPLRAGETVEVVMKGTPGGRGQFDIGDYLSGLPMRETAPGTYDGQYTIPDRFNVTQVPVYGELSVGEAAAPRTEAAQTLSATTTPPEIGEVAPTLGQTINNPRPSIFATFETPTSIPVDSSSVSIVVNGHDVTSSSTRTDDFITYSPGVDLADGPVSVTVRVADEAGNAATKTWNFTIRTH